MTKDFSFISKLYRKYLISSCIGILGSVLGSIANNIIAGSLLGSEALSVSGITIPIYYAFNTLGALLGIGGSVFCASLIGKEQHEKSRQAFTVVYILTVLITAIISAVCLLNVDGLLSLLGADESLYSTAHDYTVIMLIGGIFTVGVYPAFHLLRLDGRTTASVMVFMINAAVNIVLDFVFILGFGMGLEGVSLATVIGTGVAAITGAVMLFSKSNNFKLVKVTPKQCLELSLELFKVGSPSAAENLCNLFRSMLLNIIIMGAFGSIALSALSVTNSINSFALVIIAGVSGTLVPFIGVFSAEKDISSMRQLMKASLKWGVILTAGCAAICIVFSGFISGIFGMNDGERLSTASHAIMIFSISFVPAILNKILISFHQSNKHTVLANAMTIGRSFVFVIASAYVLSVCGLGVDAIWHSFWIAEILTLVLGMVMSLFISAKNKHLERFSLLDDSAENNGSYTSFAVENSSEAISQCAEQIGEFCESNEIPMKRAMKIQLALEEMLSSISQHSIKDKQLTMSVRILYTNPAVVLRIRNEGDLFNPIAYYEAKKKNIKTDDLDAMLELEDSLGIKMVVDTADVVDYRRTFGINNLTVIL